MSNNGSRGRKALKTLHLKSMRTLAVIALGAVLILFVSSEGWAQQKRKMSWKTLGENTKYTEQHVLDVGDVPGHQIRTFEMHRTFPTKPPVYEGVPLAEEWVRGYSDYIDTNGRAWGYLVSILESGDKIFSRWDSNSQTIVNPDGSKKSTNVFTAAYTGGTGKRRGIRGMVRGTCIFDPKAGLNECEMEAEYWIE